MFIILLTIIIYIYILYCFFDLMIFNGDDNGVDIIIIITIIY